MRSLLFLFYSGFSDLLPLAVMKSSERQQWCGMSHVYHEQIQLVRSYFSPWPVQYAVLVPLLSWPLHRVSYAHWPRFPLLCNVVAASPGSHCRWSPLWRCQNCGVLCSSMCVKAVALSFKKKVISY